MRRSAAVMFTIICVLLTSLVLANGRTPNATIKCVPSAPGGKPFVAYIEDGLAVVLDIPLAMLSPICCPILAPIINRLNPSETRACDRSRSRR